MYVKRKNIFTFTTLAVAISSSLISATVIAKEAEKEQKRKQLLLLVAYWVILKLPI